MLVNDFHGLLDHERKTTALRGGKSIGRSANAITRPATTLKEQ
jgi:hypothetical protein